MNHAHLLGRVAQTQGMARTKALRQEAGHMLGMAREQQGGHCDWIRGSLVDSRGKRRGRQEGVPAM